MKRGSQFRLSLRNCTFLDATTHLYKRSCPSVRPSVRRSVRPSVPCYFQTCTRRILFRVSGLVSFPTSLSIAPPLSYPLLDGKQNKLSMSFFPQLYIASLETADLKKKTSKKRIKCENSLRDLIGSNSDGKSLLAFSSNLKNLME